MTDRIKRLKRPKFDHDQPKRANRGLKRQTQNSQRGPNQMNYG